jgi:hypothetical protein
VAFGAGFMFKAANDLVHEFAKMGDELNEVSVRLGLTTDAVQELRYAAGFADVDASALTLSLDTLRRRADGAAQGSKASVEMFQRLGVSVRGANGQLKPTDELLGDVADSLAVMGDRTKAAALATQLFGRGGGTRLLPFLKGGAASIQKYRDELHKLGGVMSKEMVEASNDFDDATRRLDAAWTGIRGTLASKLLPIWTELKTAAVNGIMWFNENAKGSRIFEAALVTLAAALGAVALKFLLAFAGPIAMVLGITVLILGLIAVVDDIWVHLEGGKSVLGPIIERSETLSKIFRFIYENVKATKEILSGNWIADIPNFQDFKNMARSIGGQAEPAFTLHGAPQMGGRLTQQDLTVLVQQGAIVVNGSADPLATAEQVNVSLSDVIPTMILYALTPKAAE